MVGQKSQSLLPLKGLHKARKALKNIGFFIGWGYMGKRPKTALGKRFFDRDTHAVAREMLGTFLVRKTPEGNEFAQKITEVEVYDGFADKASHASRGKTPRNAPMFLGPGHWYVYFTYGMHWMLNIVTREAGYPAAILIRATDQVKGPARLTKKMKIDKSLNAAPAGPECGLWIEDRGERFPDSAVKKSARIGVDSAGRYWAGRKLRFYVQDPRA